MSARDVYARESAFGHWPMMCDRIDAQEAELVEAREELREARAQRDALRDSLRDARERLAGEVPSLRQQADVVAYKGNEYHAYGLNGIASGIEEALVVMDELLREDQEAPK